MSVATRNANAGESSGSVLDRGRIAIRERAQTDVLDLALRLARVRAMPIWSAALVGILPFFLVNHWLLAGVWEEESMFLNAGPFLQLPLRYLFTMFLLVVVEAPLATAAITLVLGQITFRDRVDPVSVRREWARSLPQLLVFRGLLRPLLVAHPYLSEIILLDRNPMRSTNPKTVTTLRRSRVLHYRERADLLAVGMTMLIVRAVLFVSFWLSLSFLIVLFLGDMGPGPLAVGFWSRLVSGETQSGTILFTYCYQFSLWLVVVLMTVARFLAYLNLRIRREGWEVELVMRAERARLAPLLDARSPGAGNESDEFRYQLVREDV